jgi:AcrR family transcriptional regulator
MKKAIAIPAYQPAHLQTRYRLLDAASRQIAALGFEGTSVREIAKEAGVTSGAIYRHFPGGKDELYAESLKFVAESVQRFAVANLQPGADPLEVIVQQCATTWDFFEAHPSFAALVAREGISGGPDSPYFQENVTSMNVLKRFMREAEKQGKIRKILPAHFVFALGSYCIGYHGSTALRDSVWEPEQQGEARAAFLAHVRDMLEPRPSEKRSR